MKEIQLAGIKRSTEFSPNHTGNDASIFEMTTTKLRAKGCEITEYTEAEFLETDIPYKQYFGMFRDKRCVQKMLEMEKHGFRFINSPTSVKNCYRNNMTQILQNRRIPFPMSRIVNTNNDATSVFIELGGNNFWIKRGDFHAMHKEDVTFCGSIDEGNSILREFAVRNIKSAAISVHLTGDLVKFYGVRNTEFFFWFYPYNFQHSKFGDEQINGKIQHYPFQLEMLHFVSDQAAESLGVHIYGGDAIISNEGHIHLIDLNDWPSFAPCREEASEAIAQRIYDFFNNY